MPAKVISSLSLVLPSIPEDKLESIRENGVCITLMLTERCNFACAHCMFSCSPRRAGAYVTAEVLGQVEKLVAYLTEQQIPVSLNLIGGEATLDIEEFAHVFQWAVWLKNCYSIRLEMTTNGSWLRSFEKTVRFAQIVVPELDGGLDNFSLRVSSSVFHDKFRPYAEKAALADTAALVETLQNPVELFDLQYNEEGDCFENANEVQLDWINRLAQAFEAQENAHVDRQKAENMLPLGRAEASGLTISRHCGNCYDTGLNILVAANGLVRETGVDLAEPSIVLASEFWAKHELIKAYPLQGTAWNASNPDRCRNCSSFSRKYVKSCCK
jgi:hypothetical protein